MRNGIYSTLFCGPMLLILCPCSGFSREQPEAKSPVFTTMPELRAGFDSLSGQRFAEGRHSFPPGRTVGFSNGRERIRIGCSSPNR